MESLNLDDYIFASWYSCKLGHEFHTLYSFVVFNYFQYKGPSGSLISTIVPTYTYPAFRLYFAITLLSHSFSYTLTRTTQFHLLKLPAYFSNFVCVFDTLCNTYCLIANFSSINFAIANKFLVNCPLLGQFIHILMNKHLIKYNDILSFWLQVMCNVRPSVHLYNPRPTIDFHTAELPYIRAVSYTHLTLPTIYSV